MVARRRLVLGLSLVIGCGGSTRSTDSAQGGAGAAAGPGGTNQTGGSSSGTSNGGSSDGGSNGAGTSDGGTDAGSAGRGSAGIAGTHTGGVSGSGVHGGSSARDNDGGVGGRGESDFTRCTDPYDGPFGGPRTDGPEAVMVDCASISDAIVLERYADPALKVPQGAYYEDAALISRWEAPCSTSADATSMRGLQAMLGTLESETSNAWFYEASFCNSNGLRSVYRNLRCDYYDGDRFPKGTAELPFLATLLFWQTNGNVGGNAIIGYTTYIGSASDLVRLCTVRTTFGDFGLCDEITLETTTYRLDADGRLASDGPTPVRTIQGRCR